MIPAGAFEFSAQGAFGPFRLHGVDGHVARYGQIVRAISGPGAVLIFIHRHVQSPVRAVLDAPVLANRLTESLRRQFRTEQVVGRLGGGFVGKNTLEQSNGKPDDGGTR